MYLLVLIVLRVALEEAESRFSILGRRWLRDVLSGACAACGGIVAYLIIRGSIRRRLREQLIERGIVVCLECGYRLCGLREPRCPECGAEFDPALLIADNLPVEHSSE